MKKILYILVIIILVLCLCSCSKPVKDITENTTASVSQTKTTTKAESTTELATETTTEQNTTTTKQNITTTKNQTTVKEVTTKQITTTQTQTTTEKEITTENACASGNHSMGVGNIGKWFNSKDELQSYVSGVIAEWRTKLVNGTITQEEYNKNAPTGYSGWSCANCGKWTGNFKYR